MNASCGGVRTHVLLAHYCRNSVHFNKLNLVTGCGDYIGACICQSICRRVVS